MRGNLGFKDFMKGNTATFSIDLLVDGQLKPNELSKDLQNFLYQATELSKKPFVYAVMRNNEAKVYVVADSKYRPLAEDYMRNKHSKHNNILVS